MHQSAIMYYDIYQSLHDGLETKDVFLDVSKAFDKVWHEGLLYKLKQNGIQGIIQKKSASGSRTLPFVISDKKVPFFPKMVLFQRISG